MTGGAESGGGTFRIGDDHREHTLHTLTLAQQGGYLDFTEFDERSKAVVVARTQADLDAITDDLPPNLAAKASPAPQAQPQAQSHFTAPRTRQSRNGSVRAALAVWVFVALLTNIIWLATSFGDDDASYYWPIWPMIGVGVPLLLAIAAKIAGTDRRE